MSVPNYEHILPLRAGVWDALKQTGKGVREKKREYQLH